MQLSEEKLEAMLKTCVPGGSLCDPQAIADDIREWFSAALRAQADARPIGKVLSEEEMGIGYDRRTGPVLWFGTPKPGLIYTHPEASAPGLSDQEMTRIAKETGLAEWLKPALPGEVLGPYTRAILTRASAATVAKPSDKLDAPAQVGNTVFRKGVEARLVVEAAQRNYQRTHNPTEEDKRIAAGVESIAQLRKKIEAEHDAKSPFRREVEKLGQRECRHCGWLCMPNDAPAKTFYPLEPQAAQQQAEPSVQRCTSCGGAKVPQTLLATGACDCERAEPGADERKAFDEAECRAKCDVCPGTAATGGDWPCAKKAAKRAAQSGQRAGVTLPEPGTQEFGSRINQCRDEADRRGNVQGSFSWTCDVVREFIAAAPTQQQEGGK